MKFAVYGFGSYPVIFKHLWDLAKARSRPIPCCIVLPSTHHLELVKGFLPKDDILDLSDVLPRRPVGADLSVLAGYPGSFAEDIAAEKMEWMRHRTGALRLNRAIDTYLLYKAFLIAKGATHLLSPWPETADGKIMFGVARELGIKIMSPTDLRNLTGSFFASDAYEVLPGYAKATPQLRQSAADFVARFRMSGVPAHAAPSVSDRTILPGYKPSLPARIAGLVQRTYARPDLFEPSFLRVGFLQNIPLARQLIWSAQTARNSTFKDISSLDELPTRFVYYPLQLTPEASINTPAPYFVDQFRAIDAVRMAMPNDHALVLKEHPACVMVRPTAFLRTLRRMPGVVMADFRLKGIDLVKRADLTVTVTGTAGLEAFLLGRPAIVLGRGLAADCVGGVTRIGDLAQVMRERIGNPVPDDRVVERVAELMSVRYPFYPYSTGYAGEPALRAGNIANMLDAIFDHLARDRTSAASPDELSPATAGPTLNERSDRR